MQPSKSQLQMQKDYNRYNNSHSSASKNDYSLCKLSIVNYHLLKGLVYYIHIYLTSNPSSDPIYTLDSKMKLQKFKIGSTQ